MPEFILMLTRDDLTVPQAGTLADLGVWAFTIGTAVLDGRIVAGAPIGEQVTAVLEAVA